MQVYLDEIHETINRDLTARRLEAIFAGIHTGYRQRTASEQQFPHIAIGRQLWPHFRRAAIESAMLSLGQRDLGVKVDVRMASRGNASYVEIQMGRLLLVECLGKSPCKLPRHAASRQTLAKDGQLHLCADENVVSFPDTESGYLFGVIAHRPSKQDHTKPAFVQLLIPDPDYKRVVANRDLNLMLETMKREASRTLVAHIPIAIRTSAE